MNGRETSVLVNFIKGMYPNWPATPETVAAWAVMFEALDASAVMLAARRHVATWKWPPTPADLLGILSDQREPLPEPAAVLAEILKAVRDTPWERVPESLSRIAAQVVDTLDWRHITDSENPSALRAQILRLAETYRARARDDAIAEVAGLPALPRVPLLSAGEFAAEARAHNKRLDAAGGIA